MVSFKDGTKQIPRKGQAIQVTINATRSLYGDGGDLEGDRIEYQLDSTKKPKRIDLSDLVLTSRPRRAKKLRASRKKAFTNSTATP